MRKYIYILNIALALGFVACDKTGETPVDLSDGVITFVPQTVETRSLINNVTELQVCTLKVWDIYSEQTTPYIDNTLVYSSGAWQYGTTPTNPYLWKDGTHKFFSYLDGMGTYSSSDKKLTVSKVLTTADDGQKDLLYSDIFTTTAAEWKANHTATSPVPLTFNHLLSCIGIVVKNGTGNSITVNSVSAVIPNDGEATVDFSGTEVDTLYTEVSVSETKFISATALGATTLAADGFIDVLAQAVGQVTDKVDTNYFVIWPQSFEEGDVTVTVDYTIGETNYPVTTKIPAGTWKAGNKYTYTLNILPTDVELTFKVLPWDKEKDYEIDSETGSINMSNVTWENFKVFVGDDDEAVNTLYNSDYAVYMYHNATLAVPSKYVTDVFDTYAEDVYDEDGVTIIHHAGDTKYDEANNPIILHHAGDPVLDDEGQQVYEPKGDAYDYFPAQGFFTVNYPKSGKYKIGVIPAYGETTVEPEMYEIYIYNSSSSTWAAHDQTNGETITNNTVYFRICAASGQDGAQHKAQIDIWFKPTGSDEWISAYSEIRANYACVIPATN